MNRIGILIVWSLVATLSDARAQSTTGDDAPASATHPLVWDAMAKSYTATPSETKHEFTFTVTNKGASPVLIERIDPSCDCTEIVKPETPLSLAPGSTYTVRTVITFADKPGTLTRSLFVQSSAGLQQLRLTVTIPRTPVSASIHTPSENARHPTQ